MQLTLCNSRIRLAPPRLRSGLARSEDTAEVGLEIRDERNAIKRAVASVLFMDNI